MLSLKMNELVGELHNIKKGVSGKRVVYAILEWTTSEYDQVSFELRITLH